MSSPGNALKKRGWKHIESLSCHPPPLHRKVSSYFINNTDSSVRHQITPAITGPVHRISKVIQFAFASQHRRIFQSTEYILELWLHAIGKYGGEQRENLWGKCLQFPEKSTRQDICKDNVAFSQILIWESTFKCSLCFQYAIFQCFFTGFIKIKKDHSLLSFIFTPG